MKRLLLILVLLLMPSTVAAQVEWDGQWREFAAVDGLATALLIGVALTTERIGGPTRPHWDREILLDLPTRRSLGAVAAKGEHRAARVSDGLVGLLMAAPFVDAAVIGGVVHQDGRVSGQLSAIALESFAITLGATNLTKVLVGRSRPPIAECFQKRLRNPDALCTPRPTVSFFSGHSSAAFTGAGLVCAFGSATPLHGDGVLAQVPCVSALAVATTAAVLRIIANKHHLTDVVVGTAVGLLSGWVWPRARFFGH